MTTADYPRSEEIANRVTHGIAAMLGVAALVLLVIASALNGVVMFIYSMLLLKLNRGVLPREIGLTGVRFGAVIWACLFYGFFSVILLWDQAKQLFGF